MRTTIKELEQQIDCLNERLERPMKPYTREDGRNKANVGNYHLSQAYGGFNLYEMSNERGAVREVFSCGHTTKKDLYRLISAFIRGIETA